MVARLLRIQLLLIILPDSTPLYKIKYYGDMVHGIPAGHKELTMTPQSTQEELKLFEAFGFPPLVSTPHLS